MESETVNIKGKRYDVEITSGKIIAGAFKFAMSVTDCEGNEIDNKAPQNAPLLQSIAATLRESHKEYVSLARHEMMPGNPKKKIASAIEAMMAGETFIPSDDGDE